MQELDRLLGVVTKISGAVGGYPLWVKAVVVLAVIGGGLLLLRAAQGGLGED
ncbi:MAG TPA: hypothetical protein VGN26_03135 [Armatimonadota bacterium]|jgi:hypothetical protein